MYIYVYIYTERERETSLEKQGTRGKRNHIVHNTIAGNLTPQFGLGEEKAKRFTKYAHALLKVCVCSTGSMHMLK